MGVPFCVTNVWNFEHALRKITGHSLGAWIPCPLIQKRFLDFKKKILNKMKFIAQSTRHYSIKTHGLFFLSLLKNITFVIQNS